MWASRQRSGSLGSVCTFVRIQHRLAAMRLEVVALLLAVGATACGDDDPPGAQDAGAEASRQLRLHAFPSTVEPGGQATISVEVQVAECSGNLACTVCLGLPPVDGGG